MAAIARRYARALFEVAESAHAAEAVAADLARLAAALADVDVRAAVLSPQLPRERRAAVVAMCVPSAHEITRGALRVLLERRREAALGELSEAFAALLRTARGEVEGVAESAQPLGSGAVHDLEQRMTAAVGKRVVLSLRIVPELIGGVRVRVGNTLYDGSVAAALAEIERRLLDVPLS